MDIGCCRCLFPRLPGVRVHAVRRFQHQEDDQGPAGAAGGLLSLQGRVPGGQGPDPPHPGGQRQPPIHAAADPRPPLDHRRPSGQQHPGSLGQRQRQPDPVLARASVRAAGHDGCVHGERQVGGLRPAQTGQPFQKTRRARGEAER